jgi:hypothetical protein
MAIVLAGGIFGIGFWLWRRRKGQNAAAAAASGEEGFHADHKELPNDAKVYHEMSNEQPHAELDTQQAGWASKEKKEAQTYELPADAERHNVST